MWNFRANTALSSIRVVAPVAHLASYFLHPVALVTFLLPSRFYSARNWHRAGFFLVSGFLAVSSNPQLACILTRVYVTECPLQKNVFAWYPRQMVTIKPLQEMHGFDGHSRAGLAGES